MTTRPDTQIFTHTRIDKIEVGFTSDSTVFGTQCQEQFKKYLDSILTRLSNKSASQQFSTGPGPEEIFMREIEAAPELNITSAQADRFRSEVIAAICSYMQEHKTLNVPYSAFEPLCHAIERYVCEMVATAAPILTSSNTVSDQGKHKFH